MRDSKYLRFFNYEPDSQIFKNNKLGADFKNNKTPKQEPHQDYNCFLDEIFYFNKQAKYCFPLPIGPNKIVQQENNYILDEILVSLFDCF